MWVIIEVIFVTQHSVSSNRGLWGTYWDRPELPRMKTTLREWLGRDAVSPEPLDPVLQCWALLKEGT